MKKSLTKSVLILALAFIIAFSFSSFAFASGWLDDVESIELDTTYNGYEESEATFAYSFNIPAKGVATLHMESEYWHAICGDPIYIYSSKDVDNYVVKIRHSQDDLKYSSARGVYISEDVHALPKGKYYIVFEYDYFSDGCTYDYEFSIDYKANISSTSITKITPKKKAFNVKYKKSGNATGYQIKYSTKKNMSNAKKVKTTNLSKTIKNLKSGKRYYVKVRSYRKLKVDGKTKTYYSKWSGRKSVKTN